MSHVRMFLSESLCLSCAVQCPKLLNEKLSVSLALTILKLNVSIECVILVLASSKSKVFAGVLNIITIGDTEW
jgi:hypothetical protein